MTLVISLRFVTCALALNNIVSTQHGARIDMDAILAFPVLSPCIWFAKNWFRSDCFRVS